MDHNPKNKEEQLEGKKWTRTGEIKNRTVFHDQISEVEKATGRTMRLLFLQISNDHHNNIMEIQEQKTKRLT